MFIDNKIFYEDGFVRTIGEEEDPFYYKFDFDYRYSEINMEFQHFHKFYEMFILLDKSAAHLFEGQRYEMKQFDMFLLKPLKLHKSIYPEGGPVKRLVINFAFPDVPNTPLEKDIRDLLETFNGTPILRFSPEHQAETFSHLNAIVEMLKQKPEGYALQVHCEFMKFLYCVKQFSENNIYNQDKKDSIETKIYTITSYIHTHFSEDLSLESLSNEFYLSPYYLSHKFKETTGFPLVNYIQMTRIRNAQQMLLAGKKKITDISIAFGFNSFSQFNRTFNKFVGKSPKEFRAESR